MSIADKLGKLRNKEVVIHFVDGKSIRGNLLEVSDNMLSILNEKSDQEYLVYTNNIKFITEYTTPKVQSFDT